MPKQDTANPNSLPPTIRAQNGTLPGQEAGLSELASMIAQRDAPAPTEDETPPLPPVKDGSETAPAPGEVQPADETPSPEDSTPAADEKVSDEDPKPDLSTSESAELTEALQALNDDAKKHLMEMAKAIENGDTSIGELKRGHKLAATFKEQIAELEAKIAELESNPAPAVTTPATSPLPEHIAKLKTIQEVQERAKTAKNAVDFLEDFLDENPNGGQIGEATYTRKEIRDRLRGWKNELEVLPVAAQALVQRQEATVQMRNARAQLETDFPWLADAQHAEAKAVKAFVKANPWLNQFVSPEYVAAKLIRGEKSLQAELATRKGAKPVAAAKPVAGKAPLGKPHAAAAAGGKVDGSAAVRSAVEGVMKDGNTVSLANLLASTGRG